jgi:hypothetical protein
MGRSKSEKHRVQFDFAPEALERVDRLVEVTEATTRADVVRNALRIYEWLVEKAREGKAMSLNGAGDAEGPIDMTLITGALPPPRQPSSRRAPDRTPKN